MPRDTDRSASEPADERRDATAAQLKADIDSGRTGDKVAGFDPAAAPLGTDAEAGGAPMDPDLIAEDRLGERTGRPSSAGANAATPELAPDARGPSTNYLLPILAGLLAAVLLGGWLLLQL